MEEITVIGIDGGKSGAIAVARSGKIEVSKMPANATQLVEFFSEFNPEHSVVFLEKVSAFVGEESAKKYAIIKMLEQVKELKTVLEIQGFQYVEVASVTWQKLLGLRFKGLDKKERKQKYFEFAVRYAHKNKILKYQGDAVCILACGIKMIKDLDPLVTEKGMIQPDIF